MGLATPFLALPQAQFVLMSATLGDVSDIAEDLTRRNGRETAIVDDAERPVPLTFTWALTPLAETLEELVVTKQSPVYVVHFTQKEAVEQATNLLNSKLVSTALTDAHKEAIAEHLGGFRFGAGFGKVLSKLLRRGIGVHHAGMLPRYRRAVEQLAQAGLLTVISGTDTLGVGINVPIRTVLFTGLAKYDGNKSRILRTRSSSRSPGERARGLRHRGLRRRPGPRAHHREREGQGQGGGQERSARRQRQAQEQGPAAQAPRGHRGVDRADLREARRRGARAAGLADARRQLDAHQRPDPRGGCVAVLRHLLAGQPRAAQATAAAQPAGLRLARSLLQSQTITRLEEVDEFGRRYVLTVDLPADFALNQPLSHFALAALDVLDPESDDYTLDIVSVIEAVLDAPRQILFAQQHAARGEAIGEMKADGLGYDERMALLDQITWPQPLAELLEATYELYRQSHPWLAEDALGPKSVVRELYAQGMSFTHFCSRYELARSEGLVLRYLTDAYRALRQTVPDAHRTPELDDLMEWLAETIRQTDSSLLDEWEALTDPDHAALSAGAPPPTSPRPISKQDRAFRVMVRNAMWRRVDLVARDSLDGLMALERAAADRTDPPREVVMTRSAWDTGIEEYYAQHDSVLTDGDARGPDLLRIEPAIGEPAGTEDVTARSGGSRRRSATPRATATGSSRRSPTSMPPTRPASWCWPASRCAASPTESSVRARLRRWGRSRAARRTRLESRGEPPQSRRVDIVYWSGTTIRRQAPHISTISAVKREPRS